MRYDGKEYTGNPNNSAGQSNFIFYFIFGTAIALFIRYTFTHRDFMYNYIHTYIYKNTCLYISIFIYILINTLCTLKVEWRLYIAVFMMPRSVSPPFIPMTLVVSASFATFVYQVKVSLNFWFLGVNEDDTNIYTKESSPCPSDYEDEAMPNFSPSRSPGNREQVYSQIPHCYRHFLLRQCMIAEK